jgi:hypothetical protein
VRESACAARSFLKYAAKIHRAQSGSENIVARISAGFRLAYAPGFCMVSFAVLDLAALSAQTQKPQLQ